MDKKIATSMGLPIVIQNADGKRAIIELNADDFIVCKYLPNNPVYFHDANIKDWYPQNWFKRIIYYIKLSLSTEHQASV